MSDPILWVTDPETGAEFPVHYSDLEADVAEKLFAKPLGGFIFPANVFTLRRLPDVPFYVEGWLPKRGKAMLFAPPKSGKSYTCLQLARCLGVGESFLGMATTKAKSLYVQFELGEEILQYRMKYETKKDYANVYIGTSFSMKLDSNSGQEQLWTALEAVEPDVLILDPFYKAILGDENENHEVAKILDFLDKVIEGFNCSVFIIHHSGKDLSRRGRGGSVFEDWVDSYIQMQRTSKAGEQLAIKIKPIFLRHAPLPKEPIEAVLGEDFEFHLTVATSTVKEQVGEFIKAWNKEVSPKDLFEAEIGSNTSVYKALGQLVEEGKVEKLRQGRYRWRG